MSEVEGLTDDHLIEVSAGVFMKFKHSYVVGGVDAQEIKLLDPHGDVDGVDEKIYNPDLATIVKEFYNHLIALEEELKNSEYTSFSVLTRNNVDTSIDLLGRQNANMDTAAKPILEELKKNWRRINNKDKLIEENGQLTGLRSKTAKNILGVLINNRDELAQNDIGKGFGFLGEDFSIKGEQKIKYTQLIDFL